VFLFCVVAGTIWLLCKGAEVALFPKVVEGDLEHAKKHVDQFASVR
jgi:hypothetical protein